MKPIPLTFNKSAPTVSHLPDDHGREIIMAGYSNVGKSSVINAIANIKGCKFYSARDPLKKEIKYNKQNLINPHFIVENE